MTAEPARAAGLLLAVVGPSGAGKDTLIAAIARHFEGRPELHFVRRVITRPAEAGGEDHIAVSRADFDRMKQSGAFACHWQAHGLYYGIPVETLDHLAKGHLVIANGSRSALPLFRKAFSHLAVMNVTARPEVLAARLAARGREAEEDIIARLSRSSLEVEGNFVTRTVDNSGSLDKAEAAAVEVVEALMKDLLPSA